MKLSYRGTTYTYNPTLSGIDVVPVPLIYRGVRYHQTNQSAPVSSHILHYRGVSYEVGQSTQSQSNSAKVARPQTPVAHVHRQNLLNNVQHRIEVAQARGDERLLALLVAEREQLAV